MSQYEKCRQNQRVIWECINRYAMDAGTGLSVPDTQDPRDDAYVFEGGQMVGIRCNNSSKAVQDVDNQ